MLKLLLKYAVITCVVVSFSAVSCGKKDNPKPNTPPAGEEPPPVDNTPWTPYAINNKRELFVDKYLIESSSEIEHRLHHPTPMGSVLKFDKPWEGIFCTYVSVIHAEGKYHMYYRGSGGTSTNGQVTCYASSTDGINWEKPNLGLHAFNGSTNNNIILIGNDRQTTHNFAAFYDSKPGVDPAERFKGVGGVASNPSRPNETKGLFRYVSPDGINWTMKSAVSLFPSDGHGMDSQNVPVWLPDEQCYAIYLRTWTNDKPGDATLLKGIRTVARSTSTDFVNWTKPERMTFGGTAIEDLYTNATTPYFRAPHHIISLPFRFAPTTKVLSDEELTQYGVNNTMWVGVSDAVFMSSRGGNAYDRTFMQSFIRPGLDGHNWAARSNVASAGIAQTGDNEMSVYVLRAYATPDVHMERMKLRLDGFTSLQANYEEGTIVTKPIILQGNYLTLNFSTSSVGHVKVAVLDENDQVIDGFGPAQMRPMIGDKIDARVMWGQSSSIARLQGKKVKLRFTLKDANLYSFGVWD